MWDGTCSMHVLLMTSLALTNDSDKEARREKHEREYLHIVEHVFECVICWSKRDVRVVLRLSTWVMRCS